MRRTNLVAAAAVLASSAAAWAQQAPRPKPTRDADRLAVLTNVGHDGRELQLAADAFGGVPIEYAKVRVEHGAPTYDATAKFRFAVEDLRKGLLLRPRAPRTTVLVQGENALDGVAAYAASGAVADVSFYEVRLEASPVPMSFDAGAGGFAANLFVWVSATGGAASAPPLGKITILMTGENAKVEPETIEITSVGVGGKRPAKIVCPDRGRPCFITATGDFTRERKAVGVVPPHFASVALSPAQSSILGLGMETTRVTVKFEADDGKPWNVDADTPVDVTVDRGSYAPAELVVPKGVDRVSFELRSTHSGVASITARALGAESAALPVTFEMPTLFIVVVTLAGGIGGLVRAAARPTKRTKKRGRIGGFALGAVVGDVVVAAALFGMYVASVAPGVVTTEAGGFFVALVAGYVGPSLIDRVADRLFPRPG